MKKILILGAALVAFAAVTVPAMAADPLPFPSPQVKQVFIATQTVLPDGTMSSYFAPGSTVVFRAYAVDPKTRSIVDAKAVKYFYVSIPASRTSSSSTTRRLRVPRRVFPGRRPGRFRRRSRRGRSPSRCCSS